MLMHGYASEANEDWGKRDFTQSRRKKKTDCKSAYAGSIPTSASIIKNPAD